MTAPSSTEKRSRAAAFPPATGTTPPSGSLEVTYDSPFDRLCFLISAPDLARKHKKRYDALLAELTEGSGCSEEELVAHGLKVRALLFFAEERLGREGALAHLVGKQRLPFRLPPVNPAF